MIIATTIGILMAGGVYLVLQRGMVRLVLGMSLISHATNLILLALGIGAWRGEPFGGRTPIEDAADPLPQAFVLTAIVIAMATTTYMLALAAIGRNDDSFKKDGNLETYKELKTAGRTARPLPEDSPKVAKVAAHLDGKDEEGGHH